MLKDLKQSFAKRSKKSKGNEKRRTVLNSPQTLDDERSRRTFDTTSTTVMERKAGPVDTASLSSSRVSQAWASNRSKESAYERDGCVPEIPDHKLETISAELLTVADMLGDEHLLVTIQGSTHLQLRLRVLVEENKDIFSTTLTCIPANLT